jgi:uracil-DNA glycosylase
MKTSIPQMPPDMNPKKVRIMMICEAYPENMDDYFYSSSDSLFVTNTVGTFKSAGIKVESINDIVKRGIYLTVAVKEPRQGPIVPLKVIEKYTYLLEEEIKLFPNIRVILLMGDTAIKSINFISKRLYKTRAVPAGSTYKIRSGKFYFGDVRVFPSYLPTGKNFLIEKSKRMMVAEDIKAAFKLLAK